MAKQTIAARIEPDWIAEIDGICEGLSISRSDYLASLLADALEKDAPLVATFDARLKDLERWRDRITGVSPGR